MFPDLRFTFTAGCGFMKASGCATKKGFVYENAGC